MMSVGVLRSSGCLETSVLTVLWNLPHDSAAILWASLSSDTFRNCATVEMMPAMIESVPMPMAKYCRFRSENRSCANDAVPTNVEMIITGIVYRAFLLW